MEFAIIYGSQNSNYSMGNFNTKFLTSYVFHYPLIYGGTLFQFVAMLQHGGLKADTWDHRESTRTVYLNVFLAGVYANMNYHIEHHIFPQVPFYNLPKLHEHIKDQCLNLILASMMV